MPKIQDHIWITADKRQIPMSQMEQSHLEAAFITICTREFSVFKAMNELSAKLELYQTIKDNLIQEAEKRGITIKYPDQKFHSKHWGGYFDAERKVRTMPVTEEVKAESVIATEQS